MNFYIKNDETNRFIDENKFEYSESSKSSENLESDEYTEYQEIKKFISERKHAMGYINEKYDDFVLMIFPTRHDIIHFEIDYKMKKAVAGILVKTEEAYEQISENIDDKDTHAEFLKTPNPPAVTVEIQQDFINYYMENKKDTDEMLIKIGLALLHTKL